MSLEKLKKSLALILKDIKVNKNFFIFLKIYLNFLHKRRLRFKNYILRIKNFFSSDLQKIKYKIISTSHKINFNENEKEFISKINILKEHFQKVNYQKEVFTCWLHNVKYFGISGGISYNSKIVTESMFDKYRMKVGFCEDSIFLKHKNKKGIYTSITHLNWANINIYHWIIECLPRMLAISKLNKSKIKFIVNEDIKKYQLELLNLFLDDRFEIIPIKINEVWYLERYFFSSFVARTASGYLPPKYLEFVRKTVINGYNIKNVKRYRRIYISREKYSRRKLKNDQKFVELVKKYNFEVIYPELLPFREQVNLFNSASIIIGIGGAALTNIIFSENLKLIIIYPPLAIAPHFFMLCKALGFTHNYIIGKNQDMQSDNFEVDLEEVENLIKIIIKN